ncbi:MAG TPA: hypothetical protein VFX59_18960 [Polyangiales bacterium]|nr:hypothetical protein [Polyangiales bacterium]
MATDNPQVQAASARVNERIEQGAQRVEQGVQSVTNAAIEQVRDARERAESGIEQQRALVSRRVRRLGDALRESSNQLSPEDELAQGLLDNASERVQRMAAYIDNARFEDVAQDLKSFASRQPAVFFGSAFLVGLALGRFAKSSGTSPRDYAEEDRYDAGVDLPAPARTQRASSRAAAPTPAAVGSAFGTGVSYSAPNEPPQPQPEKASTQPHATEPGKGTKS